MDEKKQQLLASDREEELLVEAIDLGDIETLEEALTPAVSGCACGGIC